MSTVFVLIFLGELPDKSMFATLVLATRGRPFPVWLGASTAFLIHVCIAVLAGGLLSLLPHAVVAGIAAALFAGGAAYVLREGEEEHAEEAVGVVDAVDPAAGSTAGPTVSTTRQRRLFATTFAVIFIAEWGDITQILIANFTARYDAPLEVGVAAAVALWSVAALAVLASRFLSKLPMTAVRRTSAAIMLALAVWSALSAAGVA
jgi:putative Ca2+/H+ antiporter (TMEM165/GDT1 family)